MSSSDTRESRTERGASVSQTPAAKPDDFRETLINPNVCKLILIFN